MAVQAHIFPENIGNLPFFGGSGVNLPYDHHHHQQQQQQQAQQLQFQFQLQQLEQKNKNPSFDLEIEKQSREMDEFIHQQSERLRIMLQEQRKQQMSAMIRKLDARAAGYLNRKDEEIAATMKRGMELEELMRKMEREKENWKRRAAENETLVMSLKRRVEEEGERLMEEPVSDSESCCDDVRKEEEMMMIEIRMCKGCGFRKSSVVMLPCRHLCCCTVCEAFLDSCLVCRSPKKGTIHAIVS